MSHPDALTRQEQLAIDVRSSRVNGSHGGLPSVRKMRRVLASLERKKQKQARNKAKRGAK